MAAAQRDSARRDIQRAQRLQAHAQRSLDLLNAIEATVTHTASNAKYLTLLREDAERCDQLLRDNPPTSVVDPERFASTQFRRAAEAAHHIHADATERLRYARADTELTEDDGVVEGLEAVVSAAAELHDALEDLRERIETLDAMNGPRSEKVYTSAAELFQSLEAN